MNLTLDSITYLNKKTKLIKFNFNIIGGFTNTFSREDKKSFLKLNHIYNNVKFFGFQKGKKKLEIFEVDFCNAAGTRNTPLIILRLIF